MSKDDESGSTRKTTDWFGHEKEEHFDSSGNKVGETRFTTDWLGNPKQEHFNTDEEKTGETRKGSNWLGEDRAEHFSVDGKRVGYSKDTTDWLSNPVQEHYDAKGRIAGKTRPDEDWLGNPQKQHQGDYFKGSQDARRGSNPVPQDSSSAEHNPSIARNPSSSHMGTLIWMMLLLFGAFAIWQIVSTGGHLAREFFSDVPTGVVATLDHDFPGWKPVKSAGVEAGECKQSNRDFKYWFVWGDFNGDGRRDYAAEIVQNNNSYLVALLATATGFTSHVVETFPSGHLQWEVLGVERAGETLENLTSSPRFLRGDAFVGVACGKSAAAYVFSNGRFERLFIMD